jgi:hypothetical protein
MPPVPEVEDRTPPQPAVNVTAKPAQPPTEAVPVAVVAEVPYLEEVGKLKGPRPAVRPPGPVVASGQARPPLPVVWGEVELRLLLAGAPEINLDSVKGTSERLFQEAKKPGLGGRADDLLALLVQKERQDLAGLPLLLGKSCSLEKATALLLSQNSVLLRQALELATSRQLPPSTVAHSYPQSLQPDTSAFWSLLERQTGSTRWQRPSAIPTLEQLLTAESTPTRLVLVRLLDKIRGKEASVALARRAVFDLNEEVRSAAIASLKPRPPGEYSQVLLDALRYPFAPVAHHAAWAIGTLDLRDLAPALVRLLEEDDPTAPFLQAVGEETILVRRELVRVNHFRNCLICHAPSHNRQDPVRGPVPSADQPLPPLSARYYSGSLGTFVRADVTYLRQDFSVVQPVASPGKWPAEQRYDYLVRVRPVTSLERVEWEGQRHLALPSEHRQALLVALHQLGRGEDAVPRPAEDRAFVVDTVRWKRACVR